MTARAHRLPLVGCGMLRAEVRALAPRLGGGLDASRLGGPLPCARGPRSVEAALAGRLGDPAAPGALVLCGACHPGIDGQVAAAGARRVPGLNCAEQLLGAERYGAAIADGAYLLLEGWARGWRRAIRSAFGDRLETFREILRGDRTHLLAVETPCSGDFREAAARAGRDAGLPVRWTRAGLGPLEARLREALAAPAPGGAP